MAILAAIVDQRARVEQQDCRIAMAFTRGDLQRRPEIVFLTQVDIGAAFETASDGRRPALSRCTKKERRYRILFRAWIHDADTITTIASVEYHPNRRINVAACSMIGHNLVDQRAFERANHRVDSGCWPTVHRRWSHIEAEAMGART